MNQKPIAWLIDGSLYFYDEIDGEKLNGTPLYTNATYRFNSDEKNKPLSNDFVFVCIHCAKKIGIDFDEQTNHKCDITGDKDTFMSQKSGNTQFNTQLHPKKIIAGILAITSPIWILPFLVAFAFMIIAVGAYSAILELFERKK